jgi:hypothetical protein
MLVREQGLRSRGQGEASGEQGLWMKFQENSGLKIILLYLENYPNFS